MRQRKVVSAYQRVFRSECGPMVLEDMRKLCLTFDRSAAASNPKLDPQALAFYEGQRSVILHIYRMLKTDPFVVPKNPTSVNVNEDIV
jgi:hypothetical protein